MFQNNILKSKDIFILTEQSSTINPISNEPGLPSMSEVSSTKVETPLKVEISSETETLSVGASIKESLNTLDVLWRSLAILGAMSITIILYLTVGQEQIQRLQEYGYIGIFLISLIGNATIALPIPSLFFTFVGAATFNWIIVGFVSGIGEALGESTGYLAGYGGSAMIENQALYKQMQQWMYKHGLLTIFVLSAIPNPIIDLAGIAAGASRFGYVKFLLSCWAGKTVKTLAFAWAGAHSVTWLLQYIDTVAR